MKEKVLGKKINPAFIGVIVFLLILIGGLLIYTTVTVSKWKGKYYESQSILNSTMERYENLSQQYETLGRDVNKYDQLYGSQRDMVKYSRDIARLEIYSGVSENSCVPEIDVPNVDFPTLNFEIIAENNSVAHVLTDGKHQGTFEIKGDGNYSVRTEMFFRNHYIDVVFKTGNIELKSLSFDNQTIHQNQTVYDSGTKVNSFDCSFADETWRFDEEGALRFKIHKI